jgi:23S rRNA (adenine2503-C2)-methyltransferase
MRFIYDLTYDELNVWVLAQGQKSYRTKQIYQWLYQKRATAFEHMTDLSKDMVALLNAHFHLNPLLLVKRQESSDGTIKCLFKLTDGSLVETVLMIYDYGNSVCVTSQVGCNMGCTFCASGLVKKSRDLSSGEMVAQIMAIQRELDLKGERVSHVVIMGAGEPFDNYHNVMRFLRTVNHDHGLAIGARHLTVSTCGIVPRIKDFSNEHTQFNLAISLHAPNDELRSKLMPINRAYPLSELMAALKDYSEQNNRRITFEYILLKGVNDQDEHVKQLAALVRGMNAYVNLIPYNVVDEHGYKQVDFASALRFYDKLTKSGVKCTLRQEHGADIDAACGQLRAKHEGRL